MLIGVNAAPSSAPLIPDIAQGGFVGVRFPLQHEVDSNPFIAEVQAYGLDVLLVVTDEWFTAEEEAAWNWGEGFRRVGEAYPTVRMVQVGNETDAPWHLTVSGEPRPAAAYSAMLAQARVALPEHLLVVSGAASGDPSYFQQVDLSPANIMAVHLYGEGLDNATATLDRYRFGLPLWVTEFGWTTQDFEQWGGEPARAAYYSDKLVELWEAGVERTYPYNWCDRQHPPGYGLVDEQDYPKETLAAVVGAIPVVAQA